MISQRFPWPAIATLFGLVLILVAAARLWWPTEFLLVIPSDDTQLMTVDREVLAGDWKKLWAPQDVHVFPLFRLIRLYFELHFPERFRWLQLVVILAHWISILLLFGLSKQYLRTSGGALVVAGLFAWNALGRVAFFRKADSSYILSLPLILGALYCLSRLKRSTNRTWAGACFACLAAAIGVHSIVAVLAIPGVLAGYFLLPSQDEFQAARRDRSAWLACLVPLALGSAAWAAAWFPSAAGAPRGHRPVPESVLQLLGWLLDALRGTWLHFGFQVRRTHPTAAALAAATLGFVALLAVLRKERSFRWILVALTLTAVPVCGTLLLRSSNDYQTSRYFYQSFLLLAVATGSAVDAVLARLGGHPSLRTSALLLLAAAAPVYYARQERLVADTVHDLESTPCATREYWRGWASFFAQAATDARSSATEFRLPFLQLSPSVYSDEVFAICNPRGRPGIAALAHGRTHEQDCVSFWCEVRKVKAAPSSFDRVRLPSSLAIVDFLEPDPPGDNLVCRVQLGKPGPVILDLR